MYTYRIVWYHSRSDWMTWNVPNRVEPTKMKKAVPTLRKAEADRESHGRAEDPELPPDRRLSEGDLAECVEAETRRDDGAQDGDHRTPSAGLIEATEREVEAAREEDRLLHEGGQVPRLASPEQVQGREEHPQSVEGDEGDEKDGQQHQWIRNLEDHAEHHDAGDQRGDRAYRGHEHPADGHAAEQGHPVHRRHHVQLKVSNLLLPVQLACHRPQHVQPERDHRPSEHDAGHQS